MSQTKYTIPVHTQDAGAIGGLGIWDLSFDNDTLEHTHKLDAHRDDYYILLLVVKGSGLFHCDMEDIHIAPNSILLVKPYQVHSAGTIPQDSPGYLISIAPFLIPDLCSSIFDGLSIAQQCTEIPPGERESLFKTTEILQQTFSENNTFKTLIVNNLFNALIIRVAALFADKERRTSLQKNQAAMITKKFRQMVIEHSFLHTPAFYADILNITPSHLNDCLQATIGQSVTHFLQQAMLLEAKRHLYYTNDDVKKIAFSLGFEDHAYFSRLFKKLTGETPLTFRKKFRE